MLKLPPKFVKPINFEKSQEREGSNEPRLLYKPTKFRPKQVSAERSERSEMEIKETAVLPQVIEKSPRVRK